MGYQSANPDEGEVSRTYPDLSADGLELAMATAARCSHTWRYTSFAERRAIVKRAAEILLLSADEFARHSTREAGKRIAEARGEVEFSSQILYYYAWNAERSLAAAKLNPAVGEVGMACSRIGVIDGAEPWSFPFYALARVAGPQLMAGNVLVVKHAGCVPACAIAFEQLWLEAGAPSGLYTNLNG